MSSTRSTASLRTDALVSPVRRPDVRAFYRDFARRHPAVRGPLGPAQRVAAVIGIATVPLFLLAMGVGISQEIEEGASDMASQLVGMVAIITAMLVGCGFLVHFLLRARRRRGTPERHFRFAHFAAENGMDYQPGPYSGGHITPWGERGSLVVSRVMRPFTARRVEFANFELIRGPATSRSTQFGGYCAIRLSTALPHIVVKSKTGGLSPVTSQAVPARAQHLSLEGDFDRHFTLYCPQGYERDALYLFTPDIMARLIDCVDGFDVEIIDDWLFLIRTKDVVTLHPDTWVGLIAATNALLEKIGRWERWRDDTPVDAATYAPVFALDAVATSSVAVRGRRLRMGVGRGAIPWVALGVGFLVAIVLANVLR